MNVERALVSRVHMQLREAGYPLVLAELRLPLVNADRRVDVVAFAADDNGVLRPSVAVEVKRHRRADREQSALDQLAMAREVLATRRHYLATEDGWWEADAGLRGFSRADGPVAPERMGGELRDPDTTALVLRQWLWRVSDQFRGTSADPALAAVSGLAPLLEDGVPTVDGTPIPVDGGVLWHVARDVIRHQLVLGRHLETFLSPPSLAAPLARLLGEELPASVADPFAGLGSFLWAAADRAVAAGRSVELTGIELNREVVDLASSIGRLCPVPLTFRADNSFTATEPHVEAVISQPPLSARLEEPFQLSSGDVTRDGELAAIDVCLNRLLPGGRAVLHLSRGWTFRGGEAARYRSYLAQRWRVGALIGLPGGAYSGTAIPSVILVADRAAPSETFVGQLEANWASELAPGGDVLHDCLTHLEGAALDGSPADPQSGKSEAPKSPGAGGAGAR